MDWLTKIADSIDISQFAPAPNKGSDYTDIIARAAEQYGIPDKVPIIEKMLAIESGGNRRATSPKGARGLMQLMPGTARAMGVKDLNDPEQNIFGGVRYLKEMYDRFGGDDTLALAAYNAGPGAVKKAGGVPKFKETQNYVNTILGENTARAEGTPYVWGGKGEKGFDCSGWVCKQLKAAGVDVQDTAAGLASRAANVGMLSNDPANIQSGSLVFVSDSGQPGHAKNRFGNVKHTGIVIEQNGKLFVSEAASGRGVTTTPLSHFLNRKSRTAEVWNAPLSAYQPETSAMVADVTGQTVPAGVQNQQPPEKKQKISEILGGLASRLGPNEAEAAPPANDRQSVIDKISKEAVKEMLEEQQPKNLPSSGQHGGVYYPPGKAPIGQTGAFAKMPIAPQTEPPSFLTLGKAAIVDDMEARFKILASARFPDNPEKWKDYFTNANGDIMYSDKGIIKQEVPKEILARAKNFAAQELIGRGPENVGMGVGYVLGNIPGAMAGAGAMSVMRQQFAKDFLGDKPKGPQGEALVIAKEMIMAGLGGLFGKGLESGGNILLNKASRTGLLGKIEQQYQQPGSVTPGQIAKWTDLYGKYGVDITAGEATNSPTIQGIFQMLSVVPGPAKEKAGIFMQLKRVPQIDAAIRQELGSIAPELSIAEAGQMAQEAAAGVKGNLIASRKAGTSRLYQDAISNSAPVDVMPVIDKINNFMQNAAPNSVERKQLQAMMNLFDEGDGVAITKASQVKSARDNLNKIINGEYDPDLPSTANTINREATIIKNLLSGKMYEASPGLKSADVEFARLSKPINEYLYGTPNKPATGKPNALIQSIGKIESSEDLEKIPGKVLKATPKAISNMRQFFLDNGYDNEWNGLVRGMLQDRLEKVKENVVNEEMGLKGSNFFKKAFEDPELKRKFESAMTPDQFRSLTDFFELMKQSGKIVYTNSQTTPMRELIDSLKNTPIGLQDVPVTLGKFYANVVESITSPSKVIGRYEARRMIDKGDVLFDAMFDPRLTARLSQIKKLPPGVAKTTKFFTTYFGLVAEHSKGYEKNVQPKNNTD